jgi:hypothetical protein
MTTNEAQTLEQRAAALRVQVAAPTPREELAEVERQIAAQEAREGAGRAAAEKRQVGIGRAFGSLADQYGQDGERVEQAAAALTAAIATMNDRYAKLVGLQAEARALADRFGVQAPALPPVIAPGRQGIDLAAPALVEPSRVRLPPMEECEHRLRARRSYREIADAPGYAIIVESGLKPWPPLSEAQRLILAERIQERAADPLAASMAAEVASLPATVSAVGAGVHRG